MSAVDTAWLRMDSAKNLMMIVGVYEFDGTVDFARLRDLLGTRLVSHRQFRSRVVRDATGCYWEEVAKFNIGDHLIRSKLPGRGTVGELKKFVGELAS
ncbi:MAG: wax ester/triacylglycerol synthase domain-containing protein, partial [Burkholderiaceae bacterium]